MNRLKLIMLGLCLSGVAAWGQSALYERGQVFLTSHDTLSGIILRNADTELSRIIAFQEEGQAEIAYYDPSDIEGFRFQSDGAQYAAVRIADTPVKADAETGELRFGRLLVEGFASLYRIELSLRDANRLFLDDVAHLYTVRRGDDWVTLEQLRRVVGIDQSYLDKRYVGALKYLAAECQDLWVRIDRTTFDDRSVSAIIGAYNACAAPEATSANLITRRKGALTQEVGPHITLPNGPSLANGSGFGFGYLLETTDPAQSRRGFIAYGAHYTFIQFETEGNTVKQHWLRLPLWAGIKINPNNAIRPFLGGGFMFGIKLSEMAQCVDGNCPEYYIDPSPFFPSFIFAGGVAINQVRLFGRIDAEGLRLSGDKLIEFGINYRLR